MISFIVYGQIVSQQRANFTTKSGKSFGYTPTKTRNWKEVIRSEAIKVKPERPLECPIFMDLKFFFLIPKTKVKKDKSKQAYWTIGNKDIDNLAKSVMDSCQKILYRNDNQIVYCEIAKRYTEEQERIEIIFEELPL